MLIPVLAIGLAGIAVARQLPKVDSRRKREGSYEQGGKDRLRLRDEAYLKLDVMPLRGVVTWEEVSPDNIPEQARSNLLH